MDSAVPTTKKIHPQKFALWIALCSIAMMFAGLTSGYIVRRGQGEWRVFELPSAFYVSTVVIVASSVTYYLAVKAFKNRKIASFRNLMLTTILLGLGFGALQYWGFYQLYHIPQQINISGQLQNASSTVRLNGNPSGSFLFIIAGAHLAHIAGGIFALLYVFIKSYSKNVKVYSTTSLEIVGGYWHFVDVLWIYLFVFFLLNH